MERPIERDKCLEILILRRAGCTQDEASGIVHCAKIKIGEVEHWFKEELSYSEAVELCNEAAINEIKNVDLKTTDDVEKPLFERVLGITPGAILRKYREDYIPPRLAEDLELVKKLQNEMANISLKDAAIWGLPDSEAGLITRVERGKLVVKLSVEQDNRFPLFFKRLTKEFPEFQSYAEWRRTLNELITMCWDLAHEIASEAAKETGLMWSAIPVMGYGHLTDFPEFIYEFALDNHNSGKQPNLIVCQIDLYHHGIAPAENPNYVLARGSKEEMEKCQKIALLLTGQLVRDQRVNRMNSSFESLMNQSLPFRNILSAVIKTVFGDIV